MISQLGWISPKIPTLRKDCSHVKKKLFLREGKDIPTLGRNNWWFIWIWPWNLVSLQLGSLTMLIRYWTGDSMDTTFLKTFTRTASVCAYYNVHAVRVKSLYFYCPYWPYCPLPYSLHFVQTFSMSCRDSLYTPIGIIWMSRRDYLNNSWKISEQLMQA